MQWALRRLWFLRSRFFLLNFPFPCRLPYGGWWLAYGDVMGLSVFSTRYEEGEWRFVSRLLRPGMTVFDVGANQGFYTMLAAQRVGPQGKVIAFEPVPDEFRKLRRNAQVNQARNATLEPLALGSREGFADMFMCLDGCGSFSSLRPPAEDVKARTGLIRVPITTLDTYVRDKDIRSIDFIKIDAEGGELDVMKGGRHVLNVLRPALMCEMEDRRTKQWSYGAGEIYELLQGHGYELFSAKTDGTILPTGPKQEYGYENVIAVPRERLNEIQNLLDGRC